jgi:hypothetical protein
MKKNTNLEENNSGGKKSSFFLLQLYGKSESATYIAAIVGHNTRSSSHIITCTQKKATLYKRFNTFPSTNIFSPKMKSS